MSGVVIEEVVSVPDFVLPFFVGRSHPKNCPLPECTFIHSDRYIGRVPITVVDCLLGNTLIRLEKANHCLEYLVFCLSSSAPSTDGSRLISSR